MSNLERRVAQLEIALGIKEMRYTHLPPRHRESWSQFEKDTVADAILTLCDKYSTEFGRTYDAIKWEIYRQCRESLIPQKAEATSPKGVNQIRR